MDFHLNQKSRYQTLLLSNQPFVIKENAYCFDNGQIENPRD